MKWFLFIAGFTVVACLLYYLVIHEKQPISVATTKKPFEIPITKPGSATDNKGSQEDKDRAILQKEKG